MTEFPYVDAEWPYGLRCAVCDRLFVEGDTVCEQLEGMTFVEDEPVAVVTIVCDECDMSESKGGE